MKWYQNKSNRTIIVTALINIIAVLTGYELPEYFNEAALGLWAVFMREAVKKSGPGA